MAVASQHTYIAMTTFFCFHFFQCCTVLHLPADIVVYSLGGTDWVGVKFGFFSTLIVAVVSLSLALLLFSSRLECCESGLCGRGLGVVIGILL